MRMPESENGLGIHENEFRRLEDELKKLRAESNAGAVFLISRDGQLIAASGETAGIDTTALASLAAGNVAATGGIARLLGQGEFTGLFHEGEKQNIQISPAGQKLILAVLFDGRTSVGLVRLRVKKASRRLLDIFSEIERISGGEEKQCEPDVPSFAWITDEDVDGLFKSL